MTAEARVSSELVLAELNGQGQRATAEIVLVEYGALAAYATSMVVLVEFELVRLCKPHTHVEYGGVDITDYCNSADLQLAPKELARKTLGNTAESPKVGLSDASLRLAGDWNPVIDALLGADALRGTKRAAMVIFDDCSMTATYAWGEVFVREWQVKTTAVDKIVWSAVLRQNGLGVRTVELS